MPPIRFGVLVVSDSCKARSTEDKTGPELNRLISDKTTDTGNILAGQVIYQGVVNDDETAIIEYLLLWSNGNEVDVILTAGGTGFSQRDVTPEATKKVIERDAPGVTLAMLVSSLQVTPMAMLSRAVCGIRGKTIIVNLPGSPKAARECLIAIASAIPHAVDLLSDAKSNVEETHKDVQSEKICEGCPHSESVLSLPNLQDVTVRYRRSPYRMVSIEEAVNTVRCYASCGETEYISARDAHGRVLADNVYSSCDLPPFRASTKDGYAVLVSDGKGKRRVIGTMKAGSETTGVHLEPGTCVRINTGAPVPDDATAVVQVEDTLLIEKTSDSKEEKEIEILAEPKEGQDIRPIGCDMEKGSLILTSCTKLGATEMGLLAACGCNEVAVVKQATIGVLSTGDELQNTGEPLKPGHVYDSNKLTLISILKENDFDAKDMGIARDRETLMVDAIKRALEQVDVLVTSGSVSMGDKDMLKPILETYFKAKIHFGRVNMKPGKPTTFATCTYKGRRKYFLCLPGNPVSATVTSYLFVLPLLYLLHGIIWEPIVVKAETTTRYVLDPRPEYARVTLDWTNSGPHPLARSTGNQISSKLLSCKNANALLMLPGRTKEKSVVPKGDIVKAMLLGFNRCT